MIKRKTNDSTRATCIHNGTWAHASGCLWDRMSPYLYSIDIKIPICFPFTIVEIRQTPIQILYKNTTVIIDLICMKFNPTWQRFHLNPATEWMNSWQFIPMLLFATTCLPYMNQLVVWPNEKEYIEQFSHNHIQTWWTSQFHDKFSIKDRWLTYILTFLLLLFFSLYFMLLKRSKLLLTFSFVHVLYCSVSGSLRSVVLTN